MSTLEIKDLHVSIETEQGTKEILKGVSLTIKTGQTHAIMGPNGSGKSTLASTIAGHPRYKVTSGSITLDGEDVLAMSVDERARAGVFLAMQYPVEVPGVSMTNFLRTAKTAIDGEAPKLRTWTKDVKAAMQLLRIDADFAQRNVNEGFSGGEKKRVEILQLELFKPKFAILDETDSGLDVDALKVVSEGVNRAHATGNMGTLLITHYTRILRYIKPDCVHVFVDGQVVEEGGPELGVNIVDLGLLYGLKYSDDDGALLIDMTLTTAACPLTDVIEEQVGKALDGIVDDWRLNWVWMPPWGPERITEDGRDQMRALGFNI
jgi:Fe-S cluster assembly ATP-binding protein